jgi:hypothetical protein
MAALRAAMEQLWSGRHQVTVRKVFIKAEHLEGVSSS